MGEEDKEGTKQKTKILQTTPAFQHLRAKSS
jgi:hypothetical protein